MVKGDVPQGTTLVSMGTFPLEKVEKGDRPLFLQALFFDCPFLPLLKQKRDCPTSLKKGPVPFFLLFSSLGNVPFNTFNIDKKNGV